jgi:hypothetical protein
VGCAVALVFVGFPSAVGGLLGIEESVSWLRLAVKEILFEGKSS